MANANRPTGLSPVKHISGAPYNGQANLYAILAADTNGYAIGDPVKSASSSAADGTPAITIAGTTGALRGVIVGIFDQKGGAKVGNPNSTVRPAAAQTTDWYALVVDDPDTIFEVQEESGGTQLAADDVGKATNLASGTNNGYVSGWILDNATVGTTNDLQCRLLGLAQRQDNAFGAYAKWLVKINNHELAAGVGTDPA